MEYDTDTVHAVMYVSSDAVYWCVERENTVDGLHDSAMFDTACALIREN